MSIREQNDRIAGGILQLLVHESERREREKRLSKMKSAPHHGAMYSHVRLTNAETQNRLLKRLHGSTLDFWGLLVHRPNVYI